jgi:hypothetical protein
MITRAYLSFFVFLPVFFAACKHNNERQWRLLKGTTYDKEGFYINDTIPDGVINYYVPGSKDVVCKRTYTNGILNGIEISYHNRKPIQLYTYKNGVFEGDHFVFDSLTSKVIVRDYYTNGRLIGPITYYNSDGSLNSFSFKNYEHETLFSLDVDSAKKELIYDWPQKLADPKVSPVLIDNVSKHQVFIYLIRPPMIKVTYSFGRFDSHGNLFDSTLLEGRVYWEGAFPDSDTLGRYGFSVRVYDSSINKEYRIINYLKHE